MTPGASIIWQFWCFRQAFSISGILKVAAHNFMKSRSCDGLAAKGLLVWTIHYLNLSLSLFTLTFFSGQLLWGFAFFLLQHWPTFVHCTFTILHNRNWDQFGTALLEMPGLEKYLNSTLPVGQVTLKFCLSGTLPHLPKCSNSLIIHDPRMEVKLRVCFNVNLSWL